MLTKIHDGVHVADSPHVFMGLHLGTRMTVVSLRGGGVLVHSPIAATPRLREAVDAIGPVTHIVCPNLFHHVYAPSWAAAYPNAVVHGPEGLEEKRPDLPGLRRLTETGHPDWKDDLLPLTIDGCMLKETLLVHPASRTVISADLTENFETSDHLPTRLYLHAAGIHGKIGWSRPLRLVYRDHAAARRSIERLLDHDIDRAIIAHGRIIESNAKDAIRSTFTFLS